MSSNYELLRRSEKLDEDGVDEADLFYEQAQKQENNLDDFKENYKRHYSDIKISIKEDW